MEVGARRGGSRGPGPGLGANPGSWAAAGLSSGERGAAGRRLGKGREGRVRARTRLSRASLATGPISSLNPPGDPWSTAAMPREDRATWKSNYFMKIIVSVGAVPEG